MVQQLRVFLFGDQTFDFAVDLQALLQNRSNPILAAFFEQSYYALRAEVDHIAVNQQIQFPPFNSLADLLSEFRRGKTNPAFQTALACIFQLGTFIRQHGESGRLYPLAADTFLLGLCTGALAAAAISSSNSLSELLPAAVHTVVISFRLGLCVTDMRNRIEPESDSNWSVVFPGVPAQRMLEVLDEFCKENCLPPTSRPWVSAHVVNGVTISGPPATLERFRKSAAFKNVRTRDIPIRVPAHTSHLFTMDDVNSILDTTSGTTWASYASEIPVVSSATGKLIWAGNYRSLQQNALTDILMEPLRWDKINAELPILLRSCSAEKIKLIPIGSSAANMVSTALKESSIAESKFPTEFEIAIDYQESKEVLDPEAPKLGKSKLAIIGLSGRFPNAETPSAFWDLLHRGLDVAKEVPARRWDIKTHVDPTSKMKNTGATPWGCWLDHPELFDARFFSISPKEAPQIDPAQRLALMSTYEAMEQSGLVCGSTPSTQSDRIGVFHGITSNDYMETNSSQDIDTYFIPGGNRAFVAGRLNFCFQFCGPSYTNDTACSSSLAAIHLACNSLWRHDVDTAIAGGTNMINNPDGHTGLDRGFFLSRTGNCKTYDDKADGYCRAEGVGTVIIKRLEDALAENDPILGVILDVKTNHSSESDSMTRPHVGAQKANMEHVFNASGVDPRSVGYVEMHGTGTQVGDAVEMESVLSVFDPRTISKPRSGSQALYLGSAKANIGHGEGVSGVTSLIKVLLMLQNNEIPPHCGIKPGSRINHTFPTDLKERNIRIAFEPTAWERTASNVRRALINNFSAAGGNTAMLLEDAPNQTSTLIQNCDPRTWHLVTVSAKSPASLKGNIHSLLEYLNIKGDKEVSLSHLSYTTTSRRMHHQHRIALSGFDIAGIKNQLEEALARGHGMTRSKSKPSIVFAFTGQGSQYLGMGKQFFDAISSFRGDIIRFDQLARSQKLPSFKHIFTTTEGDLGEFSPAVVQIATTCMQMALSRLWRSYGVIPELVVGHSLGEYAALNVSGVLSDADTIFLVGTRAELLQKHCKRGTHAMLAIKASIKTISSILTDFEVACINGPDDTVLGGSIDLIRKQQNVLGKSNLKSTILQTPYAFHTSQVDPILDTFIAEAKGVVFHKPTVPVISPLLGSTVTEIGTFGPAYLSRHCRETVNMQASLESAKREGYIKANEFVLEIGTHPVVYSMFKAILGQQTVTFPSMHRNKDAWMVLSAALAALYAGSHEIDWVEYHTDFKSSLKVLQLPAYSWDLKEYWIKYENDWCVTKGDLSATPLLQSVQSSEKYIAFPTPKLESTTVHRLVEETIEDQNAVIVVESDFSRPDLNAIAQGHKVNQIPLCTPSVYADMALSLGTYFLNRFRPEMKERLVDVTDLVVEKALIPHSEGPQILRTSSKIDWLSKSADLVFYSINDKGKATIGHATCTIKFTDRSQLQSLQMKIADYKSRMAYLKDGVGTGRSMKLNQTQGYKLISTLAQFHPDYRAIDQVTLDSQTLEASTSVSFGQVKSTGTFSTHPAYIDVMTQTAGFVMNGKDDTDLDVEIFVNHGWKSLQIYAEIQTGKSYQTYVKMIQGEDKLWHGDTVMFDGDEIVAFFKDVSLRGVPRAMFRVILASADAQNPKGSKKTQANHKNLKTINVRNSLEPIADLATPVQVTTTSKPQVSVAANVPQPQTPGNPTLGISPIKKDQIAPAMVIISEESGIAVSDLTDDSVFFDVGVDSLLSMVIASRFREELGIDLDIDFSLFVDLPTVKDLKTFLEPPTPLKPDESQMTGQVDTARAPVQEVPLEKQTPPQSSVQESSPVASLKILEVIASAMDIISEESGIAVRDLTDDCIFLEIGVDSLLSMVIASRFREEIGIDLDINFSLFMDLPTVKDLKDFLSGGESPVPTEYSDHDQSSGDSCGGGSLTPDNVNSLSESSELSLPDLGTEARPSSYCRPANSVILQNFPKIAARTLIMLPDGGGSSSSYVPIPRLNIDVAIVGLNCPYARDAWNMKCNYNDLLDSYLMEIRRRQPKGPYNLGGWSSGGVMAYMAAYRLVKEGEEVDNLIIIDSPVPETMDRLPVGFYEFCESLGLYGSSTGTTVPAPEWLIPHFIATVDILEDYRAYPLQGIERWPKVSIIWACESVLDEKNRPPSELMMTKGSHFLLENRTDFGPCGWEKLMPGAEIFLERVVAGNHFSMMQRPLVTQIGKFIEKAMG